MNLPKLHSAPGLLFKLFAASVFLLLLAQTSNALQITGLYSQQVEVSNETGAERNRAFGQALAAVVVKVSGERRWLENPAIERALANAQSYVEGFSYSSEILQLPVETNSANGNASAINPVTAIPAFIEQRYIDVNFAPGLIDALLAGADIPVWNSNRPSVLVWMVLQDADGNRKLLTVDDNPEIVESMQDFAEQRGLPIIFPVLDFEDRQNLSEDIVWNLDQQAISNASQRYGADSILSGRLHFTASGELLGLWQFIFQEEAEVFDGLDRDLQSYLHEPLNRITIKLANYFAIVQTASNQQIIRLRVEGIKTLSAYSALLNYVRSLGLVESVVTAELDGARLELELGLLGNSRQLLELIALDRDLLPIESSMAANLPSLLHYRWTR